jgi:hypothetical protein
MEWVEVTNQKELDAAVKAGHGVIVKGSATVRACDSATVEAWGSATVRACDSATVRAWGSATVRAWGSATVRACDSATVEAWGSATVEAWGSATVEACDSATVRAYDSATVRCSGPSVAVHRHSRKATIEGGTVLDALPPSTVEAWLERNGLAAADGVVVLFKAVRDGWRSKNGGVYVPGTVPVAEDWDGGRAECGGGLHFSPRPWMALSFDWEARLYVGCPVSVSDIRSPQEGDAYPAKVKARGCCGPVFEVDLDGNPIAEQA